MPPVRMLPFEPVPLLPELPATSVPVAPVAPGIPAEPGIPGRPAEPGKPLEPGIPGMPFEPGIPGRPELPVAPGRPEAPGRLVPKGGVFELLADTLTSMPPSPSLLCAPDDALELPEEEAVLPEDELGREGRPPDEDEPGRPLPEEEEVVLGIGIPLLPLWPDDVGPGNDGMPLLELELEDDDEDEPDVDGMPAGEGAPPDEEGELLGGIGVLVELLDVTDDWQPANTTPPISAIQRGCFNLRARCCMVRTSSWKHGRLGRRLVNRPG
jgi:hypothetical protein